MLEGILRTAASALSLRGVETMNRLISLFTKGQSSAESTLAFISFSGVMVMVFLSTADVILRYIFNSPLPSVVELEVMLVIVVVYFALPYIQSIRGHIRLEILSNRLTPIAQKTLVVFGHILCLVPFVVITWQGGLEAYKSWVISEFEPGMVRYPLWPAKSAVAIGALFFSVRLISDIVVDLRKMRNRQPGQ